MTILSFLISFIPDLAAPYIMIFLCNCYIISLLTFFFPPIWPFGPHSFVLLLPFRIPNHIDTQTQREHGRKAQLSNIQAARAVADIIRTTLGPRAMLKMILDPTGHIQLTNDGNTILREVC
jgi:hypothetical protein